MFKFIFSPLIKRYEASRAKRFENMEKMLPTISDDELKKWYSHADAASLLGHSCKNERNLLNKIEEELNNRGFQYQLDY